MALTTDKIKRIDKAVTQLIAFVNGWVVPTEERLDEWQDEVVDLLELVNDQRYPDALASSEEPQQELE